VKASKARLHGVPGALRSSQTSEVFLDFGSLQAALLATLALGAILGFVSGLFWQIARIASLAVAVCATIFCHDAAADLLRQWALRDADPSVIQASAYVLVFLAVYVTLQGGGARGPGLSAAAPHDPSRRPGLARPLGARSRLRARHGAHRDAYP
jgi:hypothetical protein